MFGFGKKKTDVAEFKKVLAARSANYYSEGLEERQLVKTLGWSPEKQREHMDLAIAAIAKAAAFQEAIDLLEE